MSDGKNIFCRRLRRFRFGPLVAFATLSLIGFVFFTVCLGLLWFFAEDVNEFFKIKYLTSSPELRLGES